MTAHERHQLLVAHRVGGAFRDDLLLELGLFRQVVLGTEARGQVVERRQPDATSKNNSKVPKGSGRVSCSNPPSDRKSRATKGVMLYL